MRVSDTHYAAIPREARGVPHSTTPGVHAYLDDYADAMERARALLDIEDRRTVDSLQCLTLGPFAERQPPHISEQSGAPVQRVDPKPDAPRVITAARAACADPTVPKRFRNPDDAVRSEGRAFQVDATCEDVAITREPLIPCVAITSPQDCIFGQSQPFLTSVLGAIAALDQIARCAYVAAHPGVRGGARARRGDAPALRAPQGLLRGLRRGRRLAPPHGLSHQWAANAAVYLNSIFTCGQRMADRTIAEANALGPSACASTMQMQEAEGSPPIGWPLRRLVKPAQFAAAEKWWAPFVRAQPNLNVWLTVQPLIALFARTNGSLDLPLATLNAFWAGVDRLVRCGAWLHHSPDGMRAPVAPSPLAGVRAATQVRAEHVTPTLVGCSSGLGAGRPATACILGVLPMGLQQLAALLQGAANDASVVAQYAHNFSLLIFRPSAAPDILTSRSKAALVQGRLGGQRGGRRGGLSARAPTSWPCASCTARRGATNLELRPAAVPARVRAAPRHASARAATARPVDYAKCSASAQLDSRGPAHERQEIAAGELFTAAVLGA